MRSVEAEDVAAGVAELRRSGPQADDAEGAGRDDNLSNPNNLFQQRNSETTLIFLKPTRENPVSALIVE